MQNLLFIQKQWDSLHLEGKSSLNTYFTLKEVLSVCSLFCVFQQWSHIIFSSGGRNRQQLCQCCVKSLSQDSSAPANFSEIVNLFDTKEKGSISERSFVGPGVLEKSASNRHLLFSECLFFHTAFSVATCSSNLHCYRFFLWQKGLNVTIYSAWEKLNLGGKVSWCSEKHWFLWTVQLQIWFLRTVTLNKGRFFSSKTLWEPL